MRMACGHLTPQYTVADERSVAGLRSLLAQVMPLLLKLELSGVEEDPLRLDLLDTIEDGDGEGSDPLDPDYEAAGIPPPPAPRHLHRGLVPAGPCRGTHHRILLGTSGEKHQPIAKTSL